MAFNDFLFSLCKSPSYGSHAELISSKKTCKYRDTTIPTKRICVKKLGVNKSFVS